MQRGRALNTPPSIPICNDLFPLVLASSDLQVFSGAQGSAGAMVNQTVIPASLTQPVQVRNTAQSQFLWRICKVVIVCKMCTFVYFVSFQSSA